MSKDDTSEPVAARRRGGKPSDAAARRIARPTLTAALLGRVMDGPTRRFGFADARLIAEWATVVGDEIASAALPVRIRRRERRLVVHVRPRAALLLQHQEPQLLERINAFFGDDVVWRLELIQAPLPEPEATASLPPLDAARHAAIEAVVAGIEPPALRSALADLGVAIARRHAAHGRVT